MSATRPGGPSDAAATRPARLIALGGAALMEGFALIGFETIANPTAAAVEELMRRLLQEQQEAFVVIEQGLTRQPGSQLARALREGARLVITVIPGLQDPPGYPSRVDQLVSNVRSAAAPASSP